MEIKGAIFDLAGTLLDSMVIWESVASDYLKSLGIKPNDDVRETTRSMSIQQACEHFYSEYGLAISPEDMIGGVNSMVEDFYFNRVLLKNSVVEMLNRLKINGVRMCAATATDRYLVEAGLRRNGILDYFGRIFTCTEVGADKDKPIIYQQALEYLGTDIKETLVFEDALYAVKTAKAAGFKVAAVYDESGRGQQDEIKRLADYFIKSFADLDALYG
ncbi:MAG: HAD family phosphatase [Clostridiales bacterium]|nr:HAD family phosphatase [Clostridiales bacterium]